MRKRILSVVFGLLAVTGCLLAAVPFVQYMGPSQRTRSQSGGYAGHVLVDLRELPPGSLMTVDYKGLLVGIYRRTRQEIDGLLANNHRVYDPFSDDQNRWVYAKPNYALLEAPFLHKPLRSVRDDLFVFYRMAPVIGCNLELITANDAGQLKERFGIDFKGEWPGGFVDTCQKMKFDLAGRVFFGKSYGLHVRVPPHSFLGGDLLVLP